MVFGDSDFESWDLGDPTGSYVPPPNPNPLGLEGFHPMKGPMFTQSLKGLPSLEPFHWRGDRVNLLAFNGAFVTLQGRSEPLPHLVGCVASFDCEPFERRDPSRLDLVASRAH